jgi:hypothetical protein
MGSLYFNKTTACYARIENTTDLSIANSITIQLAVKLPLSNTVANNTRYDLINKYSSYSNGWIVSVGKNSTGVERLFFHGKASNYVLLEHLFSGNVIFDDKWHRITITRNSNIVKMYLDGDLIHEFSNFGTGSIAGTNAKFTIGHYVSDSYPSKALIDEVSIWDDVIPMSVLNANQDKSISTPQLALKGYYKFNESSGLVGLDSSGNLYNLTLTAAVVRNADDYCEFMDTQVATIPEALNVTTHGSCHVGNTIYCTYNYFDYNSDVEGLSTFKWMRSLTSDPDGDYEDIVGASGTCNEDNAAIATAYTLTPSDKYKYIKIQIIPVSLTDTP